MKSAVTDSGDSEEEESKGVKGVNNWEEGRSYQVEFERVSSY